jgi:hydroxypyruvate isomerase
MMNAMTRRTLLSTAAAAPALLPAQAPTVRKPKGTLKQGVTSGCFGRGTPFEVMCWEAQRMGFQCFDLRSVNDFPMLKKYGLTPTVVGGGGGNIAEALCRKQNHDAIEKSMRELINKCAEAGAHSLITFSGERKGMSDAEGADNTVAFLNKIKAQAEDKGVTIILELLNSKVNHPDYMADHTKWGVDVMKRVNSPRCKLLYDIYHMQIMEGDLMRTIKENIQWIGHFHTAGNPGRNQLDENQEIQYRPIAKLLVELKYDGFLSHEYSPTRGADPIKHLEQAFEICDV